MSVLSPRLIMVAGLTDIETTLRIPGFPIEYSRVNYPFFGVRSTVSGVGYNIALALTTLGERVRFLWLVGEDYAGKLVHETINSARLPAEDILDLLDQTCQSVILYDGEGRRQIHRDFKKYPGSPYPEEPFEDALVDCSLAVLCNINFKRPFFKRRTRQGSRLLQMFTRFPIWMILTIVITWQPRISCS